VLKVKLAMAIIGISSIHLLKTFIEVGALGGMPQCGTDASVAAVQALNAAGSYSWGCTQVTSEGVMWQTMIHSVFILSALGIAWTDRIMSLGVNASRKPR
jgi:uncharacterized protein (TIGR00645 family)